ncbi:hypothetical protein EYF80_065488 [Liparis tanakae]|uniref:Uncharacterized protein n=1 Tax=Liparis tanakae TaxID=230148 RepID=A0A4Z2E6K1_9TELE|nr:hypothetical protein EYF80_065488 [Liparis tanakae]
MRMSGWRLEEDSTWRSSLWKHNRRTIVLSSRLEGVLGVGYTLTGRLGRLKLLLMSTSWGDRSLQTLCEVVWEKSFVSTSAKCEPLAFFESGEPAGLLQQQPLNDWV